MVRRLLLLGLLLAPTAVVANVAPVVDSLSASTTVVAPEGVVSLQVDGHDPDCPDVCDMNSGCGVYIRADLPHWAANGGTFENTDNGVSGSPFTSTTDWRAPLTEGLYTITASLPDSGSFICGGRQTGTQQIQILVSNNPNQPPLVESVTADPLVLYPGETSDLTCVASDPDGDPLTYTWSAPLGTITPGAPGTAVFLADRPGNIAVTCAVTDPSAAPASGAVNLTVVGAAAEKWLGRGLAQPLRVAVDSTGSLFVADRAAGGIVVLNLFSGSVVYRIPAAGVTSVDVDWNGNLLVGFRKGARVWDRAGNTILVLSNSAGDVIDVAVDHVNRRYGVLDRRTSKVRIYDELGAPVVSFGSNGDGPDQCRTPHGLAATPVGGHWADTHWAVADTGHGMVKVYNGAGTLTSSFGASGGGSGEFVALTDVEVGPDDVIYGSDSFQSWIQTFEPDGTVREILGEYGTDLGQFITPAGIAVAEGFDRVVAASVNTARLQVFATTRNPVAQGPVPAPAIDPSVAFGPLEVGTSSNPLAAVLRNDGGSPFGITTVELEGDFTHGGDCGAFVDPGQSCTFDVIFTPAAAGDRTGELRVGTTASDDPLIVALSGTGVQSPQLALAPESLFFDAQTVGTTSVDQLVSVTNLGPGAVTLQTLQVNAPYLQDNNCPGVLDEGLACAIAVRFAPQTVGSSFPAELTIASTATGSPHTVPLDGRSVSLRIDVADVSVNEGDNGPVDLVFEVLLDGPSDGTVAVDYATSEDTALAGQDYEETSGTLTFAFGETVGTFTVPVLSDVMLEADEETFTVTLTNAVGATIADGFAVGTIVDNEVCAGPNLLRNPGAEEAVEGSGIPGWTETSGFDWHPGGAPPLPWDGNAVFYAGEAEAAELEQLVDVSAFGDRILTGDQVFEFEAYARSTDELLVDGARVVVEYLDPISGQVLDSFDSGEIFGAFQWQRVHDVRVAPSDTGLIRVRLLATRYSGDTNDARFDGLVLRSHRAAVLVVSDNADYEGNAGTAYGMPFDVQMSCEFGELVSLDYTTAAGTATKGEDYEPAVGRLDLLAGSTAATVPVTIYGDDVDEEHETFRFNVKEGTSSGAVIQDVSGLGTIINDDFCAKRANYWLKHPTLWPVYSIAIGGVRYDEQGLLELLGYSGSNTPSNLAREQAATKLNLAEGSPPDILPTVIDVDAYLTAYPPGSDPPRDAAAEGQDLTTDLTNYNKQGCP